MEIIKNNYTYGGMEKFKSYRELLAFELIGSANQGDMTIKETLDCWHKQGGCPTDIIYQTEDVCKTYIKKYYDEEVLKELMYRP